MAVFGKQMEADTILDTTSTTTSLLSVGPGDERLDKSRQLTSLVEAVKNELGFL
jgi:hypothetical protein